MSEQPRTRRRRRRGGSRAAMLAKRSKPPAINPAPAGPSGGQYRPLTEIQVKQIYDTSLRMLAELGMGDTPPALQERALAMRRNLNDLGRLCFSQDMVEDIIDGACKSFVFHGRDENATASRSAAIASTSAPAARRCKPWISIRTSTARRRCRTWPTSPGWPTPCRIFPGSRAAAWRPTCPISSNSISTPLIA